MKTKTRRILIIVFILSFVLVGKLCSQQGYRNSYDMITLKASIDPLMASKEHALDIKIEVSFTTENNNQFGMVFENFEQRDFRALSIFYGHELTIFKKLVITPYVEFGNIFRKHENDWSWNYFFYYGVGVKIRIPITERFGFYSNTDFVYKKDITNVWGEDTDKWSLNNSVGLFIKLN